jgi:hypothetical protein
MGRSVIFFEVFFCFIVVKYLLKKISKRSASVIPFQIPVKMVLI